MKTKADHRWDIRPNGNDERIYSLEGWTKKQAMWEFLRRHERYQKLCNIVYNDTRGQVSGVSPLEFDNRIPLEVLVDYPSDWEEVKSLLVVVARKSMASSKDDNFDPAKSVRSYDIDLKAVLERRTALELALKKIRSEVAIELQTYAKQEKIEPKSPRYKPIPMGRALRYLDLKAAGVKSAEIGRILHSDKSPEDQSKRLDKDKKLAEKILERGIRDLMVSVYLDPKSLLAIPKSKK